MTLYKCQECSHEQDYKYHPSECFICGGSKLILRENRSEIIMAVDKDIFSSSRFRTTIQQYCNIAGWNITDINDNRAILRFDMESGSVQTLFIIRYEDTLEFSCPSSVKFDNMSNFPHALSTALMSANSNFKIGFWCIEKIGDKQAFSMMHNAEISLINVEYFSKVVYKLVKNCDDFESSIETMLRS
jgi:DNA-directed RNA polymerase subunit RPC12/RpoP